MSLILVVDDEKTVFVPLYACEYFCKACYQLRLAFGVVASCANCGCDRLLVGEVGTLNKEALVKEELHKSFDLEAVK